jgi:outer membrane receptor for ferric coprogen and ferric-rhodotorulic acid
VNIPFAHRTLFLATLAVSSTCPFVLAQDHDDAQLEELFIYGEQGETATATKLSLSLFETPQTVTAISRAQLDDFALTNINDVLNYAPGVTVEEVETDRTYYTARGFDIVNFQYDGVGIPFISGLNLGQQDTAIYEKVEVVKGASGLITGLANPSATINYVRKRPTQERQIGLGLRMDEWSGYRADVDFSNSLSDKVRVRAVAAYDKGDSYLDRHSDQSTVAYGIFEFDLSDSTQLSLGHSYDNSHSEGVLWGALPLLYSDGSQTDYDVSTSNAPEWTFADMKQNQSFAELKQELAENWNFTLIATRNTSDYDSELFYVYGTPDRETELGLFGYASAYEREEQQTNIDAFVSGSFDLAGRQHQLVFGVVNSDTEVEEASYYDPVNGYPVLAGDWALGNTPEMNFSSHDPSTSATDIDLSQKAYYFAARINPIDNLSLLVGARNTSLEQSGISYGGDSFAEAEETVPYYGITYQLRDDVMLYGSYTEVFKQQTWVDDSLQPLGPTIGESQELGIKKSFNQQRAVLSLALFSSEQSNFGEFVGRNESGIAIYEGISLQSKGYEIDFSGELFDGFNIGAGYTKVDLEDESGDEIRPFIPEQILKLSGSYDIAAVEGLKIGALVKWQDDITTDAADVKQDAYTLVDLAVHYEFNESLGLSLNIENLSDKKYLNSLYWTQGYYGAPRNISAGVRWNF